ncbi:hypothetical protein KSP39_PZI011625 [Platanthera zijinensis]|uniref:Uncharacterized protein n=1 Tax=Platanthera zijinensis TaxID=2320716 RepID=A0AAP0G624_9ASPA
MLILDELFPETLIFCGLRIAIFPRSVLPFRRRKCSAFPDSLASSPTIVAGAALPGVDLAVRGSARPKYLTKKHSIVTMAAMAVALILVAAAATIAVGFTSDGAEYTKQLTAMLPCLVFVEG